MSVRVLIVDDEKSIVKGLKYALEADGMQTDAAYDGEEALEKIETGEFDLILLDMMLPKMDGMEVCRQVRSFSEVPIVFLRVMIWIRSWGLNPGQMTILPSLSICLRSGPA